MPGNLFVVAEPTRGGAAWRQRHPRAHALGDRRRRARTHAPLPLPARWFDPAVTDPRPTSMAGEPLGRAPAVEPPETLAPPPPPAARPPACRPMTRRRRPKPTSKHGQGGRDGAEVGSGVMTPRAPWAGDPLGRVHLEPPTTTASPPPPTPPARPPRRVPATWSEPAAAHRPPPAAHDKDDYDDERRAPCPACPTNTFARPPARHAMAGQAARPRPTCVAPRFAPRPPRYLRRH